MNDSVLLEQIKNDIKKNRLLENGNEIVVGVSGGADSVCLLSVLKDLQKELNLKLTCVHVHHGLRGEEADKDRDYVKKLCMEWDIPFKGFQVDLKALSRKNGTSLEEEGRNVRYKFFQQVLDETSAVYIAVAHNREDQAETVMLHILRGTGLDGLCGMRMSQGKIIRPLLNIKRAQILEYLENKKLTYRTDSSNLSDAYTRNRVRNKLFPAIKEMFAIDPTNQLIKLSIFAQEDTECLEKAADKAFNDLLLMDADEVVLSIEGLKGLPMAMIKRIIRRAWERIIGSRKNLEQVHVEQILYLCQNGQTGKRTLLPLGVEVKISYDRLIFSKQSTKAQASYSYTIKNEGITMVYEANGALNARLLPGNGAFLQYGSPTTIKENAFVQLFDFDRMKGEITIRNRKDGDRIRPFGLGGEKKLKKYFIDKKISQEVRSRIPLVTQGDRVIWIVGMRTSEEFRAREDTKNVWVLSWSDLQNGGELL